MRVCVMAHWSCIAAEVHVNGTVNQGGQTMDVTIIVKEGLVWEVYAEDPNVIVNVVDLDVQGDEEELQEREKEAEEARSQMHSVWW